MSSSVDCGDRTIVLRNDRDRLAAVRLIFMHYYLDVLKSFAELNVESGCTTALLTSSRQSLNPINPMSYFRCK